MSLYLIRSYTGFYLEKRRKQSPSVLLLLVQGWVLPPLAKSPGPVPRKRAAGREDQPEPSGREGQVSCLEMLPWAGVAGGGLRAEPFAAKCRIQLPCREPCCYCCTIGGGGQRKRRTQDMCLPPGSCRPASVLTQGLRSEPHPHPHAPTGVIAGDGVIAGRWEHSGGPSRWRPFTQTAVCILAGAPSGLQV